MFFQPDWFDVMRPGVGTNRFRYAFNDPVNEADTNGDSVGWWESGLYNPWNQTQAHHRLQVETMHSGYSAKTSIFTFAGGQNGGMFGAANTTLKMVNGVPDALRQTGVKSGTFLNTNPSHTHMKDHWGINVIWPSSLLGRRKGRRRV
jgi:hypothetical protein